MRRALSIAAWAAALAAADDAPTLSDGRMEAVFGGSGPTFGALTDLRLRGKENTIGKPDGAVWSAEFVGVGNGTVSLRADTSVCASRSVDTSKSGKVVFTWEACSVKLPAPAAESAIDASLEVVLTSESMLEYTLSFAADGKSLSLWTHTFRIGGVATSAAAYTAAKALGVRQVLGLYDTANNQDAATGRDAVYFAAHDSANTDKQCSVDVKAGALQCTVPVPGQSLPLATYTESYPYAVTVLASGDWYDIASVYRAWAATGARWLKKGRLETRSDLPAWVENITLWMNNNWGGDPLGPNYGGDPEHVKLEFLRLNERLGLPGHGGVLGLHWYEWDTLGYELGSNHTKCDRTDAPCGFDTHYPNYFPARQGCAAAVAAMKAAGMRVIPYINGQLYDTIIPRYTEEDAVKATQKAFTVPTMAVDADGPALTPHIEFFDGIHSAVMCPYTDYWRGIMRDTLLKIVNDVGFDGAYVDQVGNGEPRQCADPTHNHTIGGGSFWSGAFSQIMADVRRSVPAQSTVFMTEGIEEQVAGDAFDIMLGLQWDQEAVPLWHSVYGGYFYATGRAGSVGQGLGNGFADQLTRQFMTGGTMGWLTYQNYGETFFQDIHRKEVDYIVALSRARLAGKPWMVHGRATRAPSLHDASATLHAGCFVREDDNTAACAIALSKPAVADPATFALSLDPQRHGLTLPRGVDAADATIKVTDLLTGGIIGTYTGSVTYTDEVAPFTLRLIKIQYA